MTIQPLTPAGVVAKTSELYALSKTLLDLQADAIESNFSTWVTANFSLTTDQALFLADMNKEALTIYGRNCATCFRNKLSITLVYPAPPAPGIGKWVEETSSSTVKTNKLGAIEITGSLIYTMVYAV